MPPDGNHVTLVSQTGDGTWSSTPAAASASSLNLELTPSTENPTLLSHYLLDILPTLLDTLITRSQTLHRTKPLQGIFLLNSISLLSRAISSSADLMRYLGISPHNQKLDGYRKTASSLYMSAWREPSSHLLDTINTSNKTGAGGPGPRPLSGQPIDSTSIIKSLSSKDKEKIKEKFRLFNSTFDDCVARHKSLYMEKDVKGHTAREVQGLIEPLYARFWDRYHEVDKGKGKVVKYGKGELASVLSTL